MSKIKVQRFEKKGYRRGEVVFLGEILTRTPQSYKGKIDHIRTLKGAEYSKAKKNLPLFNVGGIFIEGNRVPNNVTKHTNLVSIDIDNVKNTDLTKEKLKKCPYTFYAGESVSGKGIYTLIKYESFKNHKEHYWYAVNHYKSLDIGGGGNEHIDTSGTNLYRDRFLAYDDSPYINKEAIVMKGRVPVEIYQPKETSINNAHWTIRAKAYTEKMYRFVDGQKHNYLYTFARMANTLGIEEEECRQYVYTHFLPQNEINSNIFSAYKKEVKDFGKYKQD